MKLKVKKITPTVLAVRIEGRQLAPAMYEFDNVLDVEDMCHHHGVSWEDVTLDGRSGIISIPSVGIVRIGWYLVEGVNGLVVYETLADLQSDYQIVEE